MVIVLRFLLNSLFFIFICEGLNKLYKRVFLYIVSLLRHFFASKISLLIQEIYDLKRKKLMFLLFQAL